MSDSFFQQLEQRTQQVKITLANLEAEKVRIEGLIAQLTPIVPHYDSLLAAERGLLDAKVELDAPQNKNVDEPPSEYKTPWQTASAEPEQRTSSW